MGKIKKHPDKSTIKKKHSLEPLFLQKFLMKLSEVMNDRHSKNLKQPEIRYLML